MSILNFYFRKLKILAIWTVYMSLLYYRCKLIFKHKTCHSVIFFVEISGRWIISLYLVRKNFIYIIRFWPFQSCIATHSSCKFNSKFKTLSNKSSYVQFYTIFCKNPVIYFCDSEYFYTFSVNCISNLRIVF